MIQRCILNKEILNLKQLANGIKNTFRQTITPYLLTAGRKMGGKVSNKCTELCGTTFSGRSCAKVLPVREYQSANSEQAIKVDADIDEQSNRTLARSQLFDFFNIQSESESCTLFSCSRQSTCSGRRVDGLVVETFLWKLSIQPTNSRRM